MSFFISEFPRVPDCPEQCNWRLPDEKWEGEVVSWFNCRLKRGHQGSHERHNRQWESSGIPQNTPSPLFADAAWEEGPRLLDGLGKIGEKP